VGCCPEQEDMRNQRGSVSGFIVVSGNVLLFALMVWLKISD